MEGAGPIAGKIRPGREPRWSPSAAFFFNHYSFATGLVIFSGGPEYLTPKRSPHLWNGPRLGTKRLTSTAKSAPTPTPSSRRSVRQTSTLTGVLECV